MRKHLPSVAAFFAVLVAASATTAYAQSYALLHEFAGPDGRLPMGPLAVFGTNLFGAASVGGAFEQGVIFRINTDGTGFTVLHEFSGMEGALPCGGLVLSGTTLYGTTYENGMSTGSGTVFKLETDGSGFALLKSFNGVDGAYPKTGLVLSGNTLYGMTSQGGSPGRCGVLFKVNTDGSGFAVLLEGQANWPSGPENRACVVSGSTLYGISSWLGSHGAIFSINTEGTDFTTLKAFGDLEPGSPVALLLSGSTLYGQGSSAIFKLNVDGSGYAAQPGGGSRFGELALSGTRLFGAREGYGIPHSGAIFQIQTDLTAFTELKLFGRWDGDSPHGGLICVGTTLYGTTYYGGANDKGVIYRLCFLGIQRQPLSRMAAIGSTATLSADVVGTPPFSYQWFFHGTNVLVGKTDTALTLNNLQATQTGAYSLVVTNVYGAVTSTPAVLTIVESVRSTITNCTEAALRTALISGGTITFASDGTIALSDTLLIPNDTLLDAGTHQVSFSGAQSRSVFFVPADISFSAVNLTIVNGLSTDGGALYNDGGIVNLTNCIFSGNRAVGANGTTSLDPDGKPARGGAIYNAGVLIVSHCRFLENSARGGNGYAMLSQYDPPGMGGSADGGAIYNAGSLWASQCEFSHNSANGGAGTGSGTFAAANSGGKAGAAAICNLGNMFLESSLFADNTASGGAGGHGRNSPNDGFGGNAWGGPGGFGGLACGALFAAGSSALVNCTLTANRAQGGAGGAGGNGGYIFNGGTGEITYGAGGAGGTGGDAQAVLYDTNGLARLTNCTVALNSSTGGPGGTQGRWGNGLPVGPPASAGFAAGALLTTNAVLVNTLLAMNTPTNCSGTVIDAGHNLSSDASCAFSATGSLNNTNPKLGALANNGGPTSTMALLAGSHAIDAGDSSFLLPTDQRGFVRPVGSATDIGACEFGSPAYLQISVPNEGRVNILVSGVRDQTCRLLMSTNLADWFPVDTNQFGPSGTVLFQPLGGGPLNLYRVALP